MRDLHRLTGSGDAEALQAVRGRSARLLHASSADDGDHAGLQDTLGAFDDGYAAAESRAMLARLMPALPERSRDEILRLRFEDDLTQAEIGTLLDIIQVSRLLRRALGRLREAADWDVGTYADGAWGCGRRVRTTTLSVRDRRCRARGGSSRGFH